MSVQTKKRFKNLGKTIGISLFALLMFTNIKIALMDDVDIASGDISILGIELNLFDATYGEDIYHRGPLKLAGLSYCCDESDGSMCSVYPDC